MNINLEKLYAEMKDRPWDGGMESLLATLRSKRLTGNFPIPFVKVKTKKKCGIAQLPREDFPIFGIDPKKDPFDLVHCSKCNMRYRLQNVDRHLAKHAQVTRAQPLDSPENSSSSLPNTPTKASKKEVPKLLKKFVLSPPDTPVDIILSDPDISSSSGDNSYPSDGSNLLSSGLIASVKTELEAPVSFAMSNTGIQAKSKPIIVDKVKRPPSKDSKKPGTTSKVKEYDPNKHCGVRTEENGWSPCLRSLTCKSHMISLRRSVQGRIKPFNDLLLEHQQSKGKIVVSSSSSKSKKKPSTKDPVVLLHPLTSAHVQLTPLPSPVPSPPHYGAPTTQQGSPASQYVVHHNPPKSTAQYASRTSLQNGQSSSSQSAPTYASHNGGPLSQSGPFVNSPIVYHTAPLIEPKKETPMIVDDVPEQKPVIKYEMDEPMLLAPVSVECTTRVRRSRQPPQPLGISRVSLVIHNQRVFTNSREAYLMKLLHSGLINESPLKHSINMNSIRNNSLNMNSSTLMNSNTININSIQSNLYPTAQFFNLVNAGQVQNGRLG